MKQTIIFFAVFISSALIGIITATYINDHVVKQYNNLIVYESYRNGFSDKYELMAMQSLAYINLAESGKSDEILKSSCSFLKMQIKNIKLENFANQLGRKERLNSFIIKADAKLTELHEKGYCE